MIKNRDRYILWLKFIPIIQTIAMIVYLFLSASGYRSSLVELLFSSSVISCVRLVTVSKTLGFCRLHRHFIIYNTAIFVYISLAPVQDTPMIVGVIRAAMILYGMLLLLYAAIRPFYKVYKNGGF